MRILSNDYATTGANGKTVHHGGPANFTKPFSEYISSHGHEWIGVIHRYEKIQTSKISKASDEKRKICYTLSSPKKQLDGFMQSPKARDPRKCFAKQIQAIRDLIKRTSPDLLFLNGFSVFAWTLLEAARHEQLPIVIQHAGISKVEFKLYSHLYSKAAVSMVHAMERDIVAYASKQIFLNEFSRDYFKKHVCDVPENQATIIPLPYPEAFKKRIKTVKRRPNVSGHKSIRCVARWDRIKNHDAILKIAKAAKRQSLPWKFEVVTRIPDTPVRSAFKRSYRKYINIIPPMPNEELVSFYKDADIVILPSLFDVSPTVVMEAAIAGKGTAISPCVGWVSEYKSTGLDHWIVDFKKTEQAITQIKRLLNSRTPTQFKKMIETLHEPKRIFRSYLTLFKSVI